MLFYHDQRELLLQHFLFFAERLLGLVEEDERKGLGNDAVEKRIDVKERREPVCSTSYKFNHDCKAILG